MNDVEDQQVVKRQSAIANDGSWIKQYTEHVYATSQKMAIKMFISVYFKPLSATG